MGEYGSCYHSYISTGVNILLLCLFFELILCFSFSEAKKCSNGGRALMQLDFTQLLSKFEKISSLRPVPHKEYVENYVKAYYLPEFELEKWIKAHKV